MSEPRDALEFPYDPLVLFRTQRQLRRELRARAELTDLRVAILGGFTTHEVAELLELFLLARGFRPAFYQSEYNRYFEDAVIDGSRLVEFAPDFALVLTSTANIRAAPRVDCSEAEFEALVGTECAHWRAVWAGLTETLACQVVQTNFELPPLRPLANLDGTSFGLAHLAARLNEEFAREARSNRRLLVHDTASLAATIGTARWHDAARWHAYKIPTTPLASVELAHSLAALIAAARGRARKVLVLDLDNTLWGGVIGDDGVDGIVIGRETARAEAYHAFQRYCKQLRERGVLLAVCSKNDDAVARSGFSHRDSVLRLDDFAAFRASWDPKPDALRAIAAELNVGLDSLVFVDDNPAERALVAAQVPTVAVPNVGTEVEHYPAILDRAGYFELVALTLEDADRTRLYAENAARAGTASRFASYDEYLDSLDMSAEVAPIAPAVLDRVTQLTNKTNQFNLTTRRYTAAEVQRIAEDPNYVALYGRLVDTFGDNGITSVVFGRRDQDTLHVELWLMSCRVLKRGMEHAMLDALVRHARAKGIATVVGYYAPTAKNGMVAEHYAALGFSCLHRAPDGSSRWALHIAGDYAPRNQRIRELSHV